MEVLVDEYVMWKTNKLPSQVLSLLLQPDKNNLYGIHKNLPDIKEMNWKMVLHCHILFGPKWWSCGGRKIDNSVVEYCVKTGNDQVVQSLFSKPLLGLKL